MRTLWIMAVLLVGVEGSLLEFGRMIKEETGKNPLFSYISYGCYCGWGGQGQPKDATDRCCFVHDCCYGKLWSCSPKTDIYFYYRKNGAIVCARGTWCEKQICECDKAAAICFRENLGTYKDEYQSYGKSRCTEKSLKC
uniref:Basic phospholipase A2 Tbo-G6D49 n=1 Tax=Craspedocephalus borneensis TaxID=3147914 RepID=PA2B_CRABR|nr:RecName: Full=Basic phospholipase A2 Tbo-G6D49; Short=svPLA2; AltName: Full=Phosphatidylcholine 2-acylhydrolase; Flags: Precursor [Trimeresurus borneensis]AAR14173.1 G6D49 phospholipase A2 [Trimeresurus borneensis]